jgi:hypothetical protein
LLGFLSKEEMNEKVEKAREIQMERDRLKSETPEMNPSLLGVIRERMPSMRNLFSHHRPSEYVFVFFFFG